MPRTRTESVVLLLVLSVVLSITLARIPVYHHGAVLMGILMILAICAIVFVSFREVPAQPPSIAVPTFLGRRERSIVPEGWVLTFPFIEDLIVRDYLPLERFVTFQEVRCLLLPKTGEADDKNPISGGAVSVSVSIVFVPDISDPDRMIMYLNKGGKEEIANILERIVGEVIRYAGSELTWEQFAFSKARLSAKVIAQITGVSSSDPMTEEEAQAFLNRALDNGVSDIHDLGIKLRRLNVVEVVPEGNLKENAERAADELQRRQAEQVDVDTLIELAHRIKEAAKGRRDATLTFKDALEIARIVRGHATENIFRSSGNPFADAAVLFRNHFRTHPPPHRQRENAPEGGGTAGDEEVDGNGKKH